MCNHNDCETVATFEVGKYSVKGRRCYEVGVCLECGKLFNWANGNSDEDTSMKPAEIIQFFVDIRSLVEDHADEIQSQAQEMYENIQGFVKSMPKSLLQPSNK